MREVLVLTYEHGYPARVIATRLDCTVATVRYRLQQARCRMAATLIDWELASEPQGAAALSNPPRKRLLGQPVTCDVDHTF